VGERTRRITTVHAGHRTSTREQTVNRTPPGQAGATLARIEYDDDAGHHVYEVLKDSITIGRGGIAYPVDIRIMSSPDVSREHARVRRDAKSGRFFLIDLSSLGTTLNGRHVPRGYEEADGAKRENGAETALPDSARIGLADTIFLEFGANR
jgi:pSer/pThr/pTyr-binding forkhead associated (FHA) protein